MGFIAEKAVILAAGFGSRMVPVTLDTPKPLVEVRGRRFIDSIIDALLSAGVGDITVVRGYKKECFDVLLEKYPFLKFVDNDLYDRTNSISSAVAAIDCLRGGCYICEADLLVSNPSVICREHESSDYLGRWTEHTDDWSLQVIGGRATNYVKGNSDCFNCYGISFWTPDDCDKLRRDIMEVWNEEGGRDVFYEFVPLVLRKDNYSIRIRECEKSDITEIDSFAELVEMDGTYKGYKRK